MQTQQKIGMTEGKYVDDSDKKETHFGIQQNNTTQKRRRVNMESKVGFTKNYNSVQPKQNRTTRKAPVKTKFHGKTK